MTDRSVEIITRPQPQPRSGLFSPFPSKEHLDVDPFVFLDMAAAERIGDGSHFVAPHAHRGVQSFAMGSGHVMNTPEEIAQAFADERAGHMHHLLATGTEGAST